jgi:hypothetical protein
MLLDVVIFRIYELYCTARVRHCLDGGLHWLWCMHRRELGSHVLLPSQNVDPTGEASPS